MTARFVDIGRTLHLRLKTFFDAPLDAAASPLEIVQAVVDALERKLQPIGRGRRLFPYNRVTVRVSPALADRAALEAVFHGLHDRLVQRLRELNCEPPAALDVRVTFLDRAPAEWSAGQLFAIECAREAHAAQPTADDGPQRAVTLRVLKGAATQESSTFTQPVISIGRTPEPVDDLGRVRHNDLVFLDVADGVTDTVARAHARLERDPATRQYRIFNESGSNPTWLRRQGATIPVAPRDPRGVRIHSGDEIMLGRAVVQVELRQDPAESSGHH